MDLLDVATKIDETINRDIIPTMRNISPLTLRPRQTLPYMANPHPYHHQYPLIGTPWDGKGYN